MMTKVNTKYKTVKRRANVGERIMITKATLSEGHYASGDICTVTDSYNGDVYVKEHPRAILVYEYEVILEELSPESERITGLETQVAELSAKVEALEKQKYVFGVDLAKSTPNGQRKAIIKRAKAFVSETQRKMVDNEFDNDGNIFLRKWMTKVEFVVNTGKRTIVAIIRNNSTNAILTKGIAKCAPDDVFNVDIGKAIALGRALGLDVSEFVNAPKPTEVVVGSKVRYNSNYGKDEEYSVISINHDNFSISGGEFFWNYRLTDGTCDIIDDTEAQY